MQTWIKAVEIALALLIVIAGVTAIVAKSIIVWGFPALAAWIGFIIIIWTTVVIWRIIIELDRQKPK